MKTSYVFIAGALSFCLASCASIVSKSNWPVDVTSSPTAAHFTITDKSGKEIHVGTTPEIVTLKSGRGYFKSARYDIKFDKDGYTDKTYSVSADVNGWYLGNIVFGGLIGILIVDPATGAMYKLPKNVDVALDAKQASNDRMLKVMLVSEVSEAERQKLILLN